jgi:hypothetical protein
MPQRRPDSYYEKLETRLRALSALVDQFGDEDLAAWYREYLDAGEYGLAVEVVAEQLLPEPASPGASDLAAGLLREAKLMNLDGSVVARLEKLTESV